MLTADFFRENYDFNRHANLLDAAFLFSLNLAYLGYLLGVRLQTKKIA